MNAVTFRTAREPDAAWRDTRDALPTGPHIGDGWIDYRRRLGWVPLFLDSGTAGASSEPRSVGVAYVRRPRWRPWKRPELVLDRLPWQEQEDADGAVNGLLAIARDLRARRVEVQSFDGPTPAPLFDGWNIHDRYEFVLDLTADEDALLAGMKGSHRRKLRKAEKAGLEVGISRDPQDMQHLGQAQEQTQRRRATRGESMDRPSDDQYARLADALVRPDAARLYLGRLDGRVVSAVLVGRSAASSYYFMGGTHPDGLAVNAATKVLWDAMLDQRREGVRAFNLGGVAVDAEDPESLAHGLYRFKDGWGATRLECRSGTWPGAT